MHHHLRNKIIDLLKEAGLIEGEDYRFIQSLSHPDPVYYDDSSYYEISFKEALPFEVLERVKNLFKKGLTELEYGCVTITDNGLGWFEFDEEMI